MNKKLLLTGTAATLLVICASGAVSTKISTTQWEYGQLIVSTIAQQTEYLWKTSNDSFTLSVEEMAKVAGVSNKNFSILAVFNYLGKDGWELFRFPDTQEEYLKFYYFKRCKP